MKQLAKDQRGFMERRTGKSFEQSKKKSINFAYGQKIFRGSAATSPLSPFLLTTSVSSFLRLAHC
jgi:hypothetical protein